MIEFNFKSQRATTIEQSERLIALGLRKETADVTTHYEYGVATIIGMDYPYYVQLHTELGHTDKFFENIFPAWSLHRLLSLIPLSVSEFNLEMDGVYSIGYTNLIIFCKGYLYDNIVDCIEWLIKEGYFNKEYLV